MKNYETSAKNELDKLREMLTEAKIPYEDCYEEHDEVTKKFMREHPDYASSWGEIGKKWRRNQVVYGGKTALNRWKWDGICQWGSYGASDGMIESYGELGEKDGSPQVVTAEEAFAVIKAHWDKEGAVVCDD